MEEKRFNVRKLYKEMEQQSTDNIVKTINAARDRSPKDVAMPKKLATGRPAVASQCK